MAKCLVRIKRAPERELGALAPGKEVFNAANLRTRAPAMHGKWRRMRVPTAHPGLRVRRGGVASWERVTGA